MLIFDFFKVSFLVAVEMYHGGVQGCFVILMHLSRFVRS